MNTTPEEELEVEGGREGGGGREEGGRREGGGREEGRGRREEGGGRREEGEEGVGKDSVQTNESFSPLFEYLHGPLS